MGLNAASLEARLLEAVLADPVCAAVLERLPRLGLPDWWLTAGAVFQNVWNAVSGLPAGHGIKDYDVFYFDDADLSWEAEDRVIRAAAGLFADLPATVEVRNEARVHLWYEEKFGVACPAFTSAADAIDAFAATTCCVGVTRAGGHAAEGGHLVHAPFGLEEVFAMRMRPNPRLAPREVYEAKVLQYQSRWPRVTSEPWPTPLP
ncbi:MAG: nucleotidyltransferase family protein [Micrococcales bacterium]|nr:nucleotidyltransferase family protein [Micrococcales bacterium]